MIEIILIIVGVIVGIIALIVVLRLLGSIKRKKRLKNSMAKVQEELNTPKDELQEKVKDKIQIVEEPYDPIAQESVMQESQPEQNEEFDEDDDEEFQKFINETLKKQKKKQQPKPIKKTRDEEFEDFMNEHAFSRRILDKNILDKIRSLPPEIKAVILTNVLGKYDEK